MFEPRLTDGDRAEIDLQLQASDKDFGRDLLRYLATGDESGRRVFRSRALAERTADHLRRVQIDAQGRIKATSGEARRMAIRVNDLCVAELKALRPILKAMQTEAADASRRRQAERLCAEANFSDMRFLADQLAQRVSGKDAVAALKHAKAEGEVGKRKRANELLGQLLPDVRDHLVGLLERGASREEMLKAAETLLARRGGGPV